MKGVLIANPYVRGGGIKKKYRRGRRTIKRGLGSKKKKRVQRQYALTSGPVRRDIIRSVQTGALGRADRNF